MLHRVVCYIVLALFVFPVTGNAFQGYVQPFENGGYISWGNGDVSVMRSLQIAESGQRVGTIAVRKAASQARKQLLDIIMGVRIDARQTIGAYLAGDDVIAARVRGMIQNSSFDRPALFEDGGEVRVFEALRGKLAELVLPTTIPFQSGIPPKLSTSMEQSFSYGEEDVEAVGGSGYGYTGLIIDARGLKVTPALAPVIYGQDGVGVYGPFVVGRANAITHGVVAYANTVAPAALRERVGDKPLTVKAMRAYGSWRTDLIVSSSMAGLMRAVLRPGDIVDECRVIIVVDPPVNQEENIEGVSQIMGEEQ